MGRMYSVLQGRTWKPVFLSTQGLPARFEARLAALRLAATSLARRGLWPQAQGLEESEESQKPESPFEVGISLVFLPLRSESCHTGSFVAHRWIAAQNKFEDLLLVERSSLILAPRLQYFWSLF